MKRCSVYLHTDQESLINSFNKRISTKHIVLGRKIQLRGRLHDPRLAVNPGYRKKLRSHGPGFPMPAI